MRTPSHVTIIRIYSAPKRARTAVWALRGPRPGPLDDGGLSSGPNFIIRPPNRQSIIPIFRYASGPIEIFGWPFSSIFPENNIFSSSSFPENNSVLHPYIWPKPAQITAHYPHPCPLFYRFSSLFCNDDPSRSGFLTIRTGIQANGFLRLSSYSVANVRPSVHWLSNRMEGWLTEA
jgi:hypothetical protein